MPTAARPVALDRRVQSGLHVLAHRCGGAIRVTQAEHRQQVLVVGRLSLRRGQVGQLILRRDQAEPRLRPDLAVRPRQPGAPGGVDESEVELEVCLHRRSPGRPGGHRPHPCEGVVERCEAVRVLGHEARRLALEHGTHAVHVVQLLGGELGDPHTAVRGASHEPVVDEAGEPGTQRLTADVEGVGELDLAEPCAGRDRPVEDLAGQRLGDRIAGRRSVERRRPDDRLTDGRHDQRDRVGDGDRPRRRTLGG